MNISIPKPPNKTQIFWLGETTQSARDRSVSGIVFEVPPRCRNGSDLRSGTLTAYRDFSNAVDAAFDAAENVTGVYPMVSCLRLPDYVLIEPKIPHHVSRLHPNEDPLKALMEAYDYSKVNKSEMVWPIFDRYFEGIKNELLADDSIAKNIHRACRYMFAAAARISLARQDDWEIILRHELSTQDNDSNWFVRDSQTGKFVKPLPAILQCEVMRDNRLLDHESNNIISRPSVSKKIIKFNADAVPAAQFIKGARRPDGTPGPRIDFVFSFEANWTVPNPDKNHMGRVIQHQLGLHFGQPHTVFFKAWNSRFGGAENIVWDDHRNEPVTP